MAKKKEPAPEAEQTPEVTPETEAPETEAVREEENPLAEKCAQLEQSLAAEKDKCLRLMAEYDNFRKRSAKERENIYADVRSDTIVKLLPVYDNLERALKQETEDEAYRKGVEMTMNQLTDILAKLGVTPIEAAGAAFNPAVHNAVMHVEDESLPAGVVVEEFQKGFKLGDKVIRFSMVKVAN